MNCMKSYSRSVEAAVSEYKKQLKTFMDNNPHISDDDLHKEHLDLKGKAEELHRTSSKIGRPGDPKLFEEKLCKSIDEHYKNMRIQNLERWKLIESEIKNLERDCLDEYQTSIMQEIDKLKDLDELQDFHKHQLSRMEAQFKSKCKVKDEAFMAPYLQSLVEGIDVMFLEDIKDIFDLKLSEGSSGTNNASRMARKYYPKEMEEDFKKDEFLQPNDLDVLRERLSKKAEEISSIVFDWVEAKNANQRNKEAELQKITECERDLKKQEAENMKREAELEIKKMKREAELEIQKNKMEADLEIERKKREAEFEIAKNKWEAEIEIERNKKEAEIKLRSEMQRSFDNCQILRYSQRPSKPSSDDDLCIERSSTYFPPITSTQLCNEEQSQKAGQTITNVERGFSAKPLGSTLHSQNTGADKQPTIVESTSYSQNHIRNHKLQVVDKANMPFGQRHDELPPKPKLPPIPKKSTPQPSQPPPSKYEEANLDIDETISKRISEIKDMHTSLLNISKPGPFHIQLESLKKRHDEFVNRRSTEFRNFLAHLALSDAQKQEFIKTLETSLRLTFDLKVNNMNTSHRKHQRTQESELQPGSVPPSYGKNACESPVVTLQPEIPSYGSLSPSEEMMNTTEAPVVGNDFSAEDKTVQKDGKSSEDMEIDVAPPPPPMKSHEIIQDTVSVYMEMYKEEMDRLFRSNFLPSEEAIEKRHVKFANTKIAKLFENGAQEVGAILIKKVATALNVHKEHLHDRKEFVADSVAKYKVELEESVESWITLNIECKNQLPNVDDFFSKVFKSFCTKMSRTYDLDHLQYDAEKRIWDKVQKEGIRLLEGLQSALRKYHAEMSMKFQLFRCVNDEKFNEFHKSATDAAVKSLHHGDNWVTQKFESGLWQLRLKFEERNNNKMKQGELQLPEELSNNIKTQYHNSMDEVLKTRSFASNELKEIHNKLVGDLLKALKTSADFNPSSGISTEDIKSKLKQELDRIFTTTFEKRNRMKLEKISLTLKKEIQDKRTEYNSRMDLLVTRSGKSISSQDLQKKHDDFVEELCRSLEFKMKKIDPLLMPETPANVKKLKSLIEVDWTQVKIANNRNKEAQQQNVIDGERDFKKKEEFKMERKRKEAEDLKLKKQESVATARSSQTFSSSRSSTDRGGDPRLSRSFVSTNYTIPIIPRPLAPIVQDVPPVAIEFGFDKIRWGWYNTDGRFAILKNKFGEFYTPTNVGLSQENRILIGPELDVGKSTVKFVISLAEVLMDDTVDRQYELDVNSELQLVRKEFLYGLLLGRLKYDYECQLGGIFSTAVITVPLWYPSTHRQAIKDAGIIAGFANVHLINEPTAVALCMANTGERNESGERNLILIGVQSERHFDAAVYTHSKGVVEMECSFGDLHNLASASIFPSFCRKVLNNLTSTPELKTYVDTCLGMHKPDVKENLFVRVGEIKEYKGIQTVVTSYGKPCSQHERLEDALLKGAAEFARSMGEEGNPVNFRDISSYSFDRFDKWDNKYINMFNYPTPCSKSMSSEHTINIRDWKDYNLCKISQTSRKGEVRYPVMTIQLNPDNDKEFRQAKVGFSLDRDDILKVSYIKYGKSLDYKDPNNLTFIPYDGNMEGAIISLNLDDILKATYASLVDSFKRDKQRVQLKKEMDLLQGLVDLIEPKISGIVKKIGQTTVTNSVAEARAFLSHPKTKLEEVRSKYESLSKLASKYDIL